MISLLEYSYLNGYIMVSHCGFHFYFSNYIEHLFMYLLAIYISSLGRRLFRSLPIFLLSCSSYFLVVRVSLFVDISPSLWLVFAFFIGIFWRANVFNFDNVQFIFFSFLDHTFSIYLRNIPNPRSQSYFLTLELMTSFPLKMTKNLDTTTMAWQSLLVLWFSGCGKW